MPQARKRNRNEAGGPNAEPVTLEEAKAHARVTHSDDDTLIERLIRTATNHTEELTGRVLIEQTIDVYMDSFPGGLDPIRLPLPPLISITSIKYFDTSDVEQTWNSALYTVDTDQPYNGLVYPAIRENYPQTRSYPKAIHIEAQAGYADSVASPVDEADNIPDDLKNAILMLITHLYENREATTVGIEVKDVPMGYDQLIDQYTVRRF